MENKTEILIPEATYHVYNRANGSERLFRSEENYRYFLRQYQSYINPIAHTFCYCLMPNHFHFLIRIKTEQELKEYFEGDEALRKGKSAPLAPLTGFETLSEVGVGRPGAGSEKEKDLPILISRRFSDLFNGYTQAFNKQHKRRGSLFMRPYKRKRVYDETYLRKLVHYIHHNPVNSCLCHAPQEWPHSSYSQLIHQETTFLRRAEILDWFGDRENFIYSHTEIPELSGIHTR